MGDLAALEEIYTTPQEPGSFSGIQKLQKALKEKNEKVSTKQLQKWLEQQDTYTSLRDVHRRIARPQVIVYGKDQQWDADTGNYAKWQQDNDGYAYFLLCIDIFTRYVWTRPLKTLQGREMKQTLMDVFQEATPKVLRTDGGTEFNNALVKALLKEEDVEHVTTLNEVKANYAERAIKTVS